MPNTQIRNIFPLLILFSLSNLAITTASNCQTQVDNSNISLGAYYYGGWTSLTKWNVTKSLKDTFLNREPKWGWVTSDQKVMNEQIVLAADAGLKFFSFCWYYNNKTSIDSSNRDLAFYLNSPNRKKLKYCLMVANHQGFEVGPQDWTVVVNEWVKQFKTGTYLEVDHKPLLIFFSVHSLIEKFGNTNAVRNAFAILQTAASREGLQGVSLAACVGTGKAELQEAESCGFNVLTAYNYHSAGFKINSEREVSIDSMTRMEKSLWDKIADQSQLPYIPVATLNWDPRPWANASNKYSSAPYFVGFSAKSVTKSVNSTITWLNQNPTKRTKEQIALLYAWNEYGEGAWLTPSKNSDEDLLGGIKNALGHK